jgi:PhoD-like phosphatase
VARLLLGPLLRHVSSSAATLWMETDGPCEVEVLGHRSPTFHVAGHHYALVVIRGLPAGEEVPYEVTLDGERAWPEPGSDFPAPVIRPLDESGPLQISFGSCRCTAPHEPPWNGSKDHDERGREVDALYAVALRLRDDPDALRPDLLLLLGDQVYADEDAPGTRARIRAKRDVTRPPGLEVADFEEYTWLYHESWSDPVIRWLLSTVPTAMIFDDHDVHDDWNISWSWLQEKRATDWWEDRIAGALMSYWLYQHLGNLSPDELEADELLARVRAAEDGHDAIREFVLRADHEVEGARWSVCRDLGDVRLLLFDSREGRVLRDRPRKMADDGEWRWVTECAERPCTHLLLASTLPWLLNPTFHWVEAWNEAVCDGAWGGRMAGLGEKLRRGLDLEHWSAFRHSFDALAELIARVGSRPDAPATITNLGGDVHHAYLAEVAYPRSAGVTSHVWQAVCSPFRNPLTEHERRLVRVGLHRGVMGIARLLARAAGVPDPPIRWRFVEPPTFDNQVATLELDGRSAKLRIERTSPGSVELRTSLERSL